MFFTTKNAKNTADIDMIVFFVIIIFILISSLFYIFEPLIGKINIYLMLSLIFLVAAIFMVFKTLVKANIYKQLKPQVDPIE